MPKVKKEKSKTAKSSGKGEKFADMSATAVVIDEASLEKGLQEKPKVSPSSASPEGELRKGKRIPQVRGKKYQDARKLVDKTKTYSPKEAFELLKKVSYDKSGGAVEVHFNVIEKGLAGEARLPYFESKAQKVVIFDENLAEEIKTGKINFDVLFATAADMPKILPLAKILGPKGLMPNPKTGTLVPDPKKAMENFSKSVFRYKTEKDFPLIHTKIGKLSQPTEEVVANFEALIKAINPKNIKKIFVKSTMSPSIRISIS